MQDDTGISGAEWSVAATGTEGLHQAREGVDSVGKPNFKSDRVSETSK